MTEPREAARTSAETLNVPQEAQFRTNRSLALIAWISVALVLLLYVDQIRWLWNAWLEKEEYNHGLLMPFIAAYLLWQRRAILAAIPLRPSWIGVILLLFALLFFVAGSLAHLEVVKNYSMVIALAAISLAFGGVRLLKQVSLPLLLIFLVIPLPSLINSQLTTQLQLVSSEIGVWIIRSFGISVHLSGNVIDMGSYQLMVVEACSGLTYMIPLISLAVMLAFFYKGPIWHRVVLVLSTVPITILLNSFRIGITGVLVEHFGLDVGQGFLHDFQGWIIFMFASIVLLLELKALLVISLPHLKLSDAFFIPLSPDNKRLDNGPRLPGQRQTGPIFATLTLIAAGLYLSHAAELDRNAVPERALLDDFPSQFGDWEATRHYLSQDILDVLQADDYFLGDYNDSAGRTVELYMVYHALQQSGSALHNPEVCIPGGGWNIDEQAKVTLKTPHGEVNAVRMVISNLQARDLVYFWFQQQGRTFNDENLARASLLLSAVKWQRTDTSLVRVRIPLSDQAVASAEDTLQEFIAIVTPKIRNFIPD